MRIRADPDPKHFLGIMNFTAYLVEWILFIPVLRVRIRPDLN